MIHNPSTMKKFLKILSSQFSAHNNKCSFETRFQ